MNRVSFRHVRNGTPENAASTRGLPLSDPKTPRTSTTQLQHESRANLGVHLRRVDRTEQLVAFPAAIAR